MAVSSVELHGPLESLLNVTLAMEQQQCSCQFPLQQHEQQCLPQEQMFDFQHMDSTLQLGQNTRCIILGAHQHCTRANDGLFSQILSEYAST